MSCHRVRRELLWMTRFGEFGPDSQRHLDHLAGCRACRDEVGCDRHTVRLLRAALAERVEGMEPSSAVWEQVRTLAQEPEPRRLRWPWRRATEVMALGRTLTAMAGTGLALVLALNTQIVTVTLPQPDGAFPSPTTAVRAGLTSAWDRLPGIDAGDRPAMRLDVQPDPEGLVVNVDTREILESLMAPAVEEPAEEQPADVVLFAIPLPLEPPPAASQFEYALDDAADWIEPASSPAGAPT
jgi:hypothetical protein